MLRYHGCDVQARAPPPGLHSTSTRRGGRGTMRTFQSARPRRAAWLAFPAFLALFVIAGATDHARVSAQAVNLSIQVQVVDPQGNPIANPGDLSGFVFSATTGATTIQLP